MLWKILFLENRGQTMIKIIKSNYIAIICLIIYSIITITRMIHHTPWFDEAHAWTIAEQLNFVDMFNYVKNEGHFFIWQALLYPFAHSHIIPYPYPMQALNWIFCFSALIIMWWKAPFNNWIKALITFSFPFLGCYGVLARCYSVGILLLFALALLFDKKLQYPKTYALLLILCANTSVMALIGATAFGILFLIDIFKNKLTKKECIFTGSILIIGAALILYQVLCIDYFSTIVESGHFYTTMIMFENTYVYHNLLINSILTLVFAIPIFLYMFNDKKSLFFLSFTYISMLFLAFKFYGINFWHAYFFYICLIIAFWIHKGNSNFKKFSLCILALISFILIFHYPEKSNAKGVFDSKVLEIKKYIESDEILKKSLIIHNTGILYELMPYTSKSLYQIRNYCSTEVNTDYDLYNIFGIFNTDCVRGNIFGQAQKHPDIIKKFAILNSYAYTQKDKNPQINNYGIIMANGYSLLIQKYKCFNEHCFWKIEVKQ